MGHHKKQFGFTIVELLIVVVVIAILAAVSIVAYNGISNRAKASAASSAAQQATKKLMSYAIANADDYPGTLADAGLNGGSATYQYRVDNTTNPKTFCITATSNNVSYYASSSATTPIAGACPGHGANGGQVTTNLIANPKLALDAVGWSHAGIASGGRQPASGSGFDFAYTATGTNIASGGRINYLVSGLTVGTTYTVALTFLVSGGTWSLRMTEDTNNTNPQSVSGNLTADGQWRRQAFGTFTAANSTMYLQLRRIGAGSTTENVALTGIQLSNQSVTAVYGDGDTAGWAWNGTPNASTSAGPAL